MPAGGLNLLPVRIGVSFIHVSPGLGVLALLGARSPETVRLPLVEGATSVAVVVDRVPRTIAIAAYGPDAAALAITVQSTDDPLSALYFGPDVTLPYGVVTESTTDLWTRPLPTPLHVEARASSDAEWRPLDATDLDPVLIPFESPIDCAARGGCFADAEAWSCTIPCPSPPAIAPPEGPRSPVFAPCPSGWVEDATLQTCLAPIEACPTGQRRLPGDAACRDPGPACGDEWALDLDDATTRFVRAGVVGGDGTRARPFATIAEAMPAAVIALAQGEHALPERIAGRIVGACAARTRLVGSTTVALDGAVVEALSIELPSMRVLGEVRFSGVAVIGAIGVAGALRLDDATVIGAVTVESGGTLLAREGVMASGETALRLGRTASATVERAALAGAIVVDGAR